MTTTRKVTIIIQVLPKTDGFEVFVNAPLAVLDAPDPKFICITVSAELLMDETIYPVCGPSFAAKHRDATAEGLPDLPLLHVDWADPEWADWDEVFRRAQIPHGPNKGRRFSKFSVALQAAQADQGVAVGWDRLVRPMIKEGKLVRLTDLKMPAPGGYYLTWNDRRTLSPAAETLRTWLREMAQQERQTF